LFTGTHAQTEATLKKNGEVEWLENPRERTSKPETTTPNQNKQTKSQASIRLHALVLVARKSTKTPGSKKKKKKKKQKKKECNKTLQK
jgi:hypothetical protein